MTESRSDAYERFETSTLTAQQMVKGEPYLEFLRRESMSAGVYVLEAGSVDSQQPHAEDELYCVLEGRAVMEVAGDQRPGSPAASSSSRPARRTAFTASRPGLSCWSSSRRQRLPEA